jgi:hypothetical protein
MDNWLALDMMVKQAATERARCVRTRVALEIAAHESKGRLRARLASLLARAAICLDREAGRATLAGAPNH